MIGDPYPVLVAERSQRLAALGPRPPWYRPIRRRRWDLKRRSIMAMDVSVFTYMLRDLYPPSEIIRLANRPRVSLGTMEKR